MKSGMQEFLNENESRAYPIREEASQRDQSGLVLPTDIIADVCVIVPWDYRDVYCTAVRVTPRLYSIAFACAAGPLLAGTYSRDTYRPYTALPLQPLVDDVSGWVVFGAHRSVVTERYIFDSVAASGLDLRAVRVVERLPVRRLLKLGGALTAYADKIASVLGAVGLTIKQENSKIVIQLDKALEPSFRPLCSQSASTESCGVPPIRRINGVTADANGQITLRFIPYDWVAP